MRDTLLNVLACLVASFWLLATLLVIIYVGWLTILNARNPVILIPALLTGFLVNPAWYIWLGTALRRER